MHLPLFSTWVNKARFTGGIFVASDRERIRELGRGANSVLFVHDALQRRPLATTMLTQGLDVCAVLTDATVA